MTGAGVPSPLAGWRVLVPRPPEKAGELSTALRAMGAIPVPVQLISIVPPDDAGDLDRQLVELAAGAFDWIGLTSATAVSAVLDRSAALGLTPPVPASTRVAAVGPATAATLRAAGLPVDLLPPVGGSAAALAAAWPRPTADDQAVLLPRSDIAAPTLPDALRELGYRVLAVTAYRTVVQPAPADLAAELIAGGFDAVLFTSPSTVASLAGVSIAESTVIGAIGAPTARALTTAGRSPQVVADRPTAAGLVDALTATARTNPRPVEA